MFYIFSGSNDVYRNSLCFYCFGLLFSVNTMIIIETTGGIKEDRNLAENVMDFCVKKLLSRHRNLNIQCIIRNTLKENAYGFCYKDIGYKSYIIEIDRRLSRDGIIEGVDDGIDAFISTVCHEMVHVMQNATKSMVSTHSWRCKDGKYRRFSKKEPWETEAYALQGPLAKEFIMNNFNRQGIYVN